MTLKQDRVHFVLIRNRVIKLRYGCCTKQGFFHDTGTGFHSLSGSLPMPKYWLMTFERLAVKNISLCNQSVGFKETIRTASSLRER